MCSVCGSTDGTCTTFPSSHSSPSITSSFVLRSLSVNTDKRGFGGKRLKGCCVRAAGSGFIPCNSRPTGEVLPLWMVVEATTHQGIHSIVMALHVVLCAGAERYSVNVLIVGRVRGVAQIESRRPITPWPLIYRFRFYVVKCQINI